MTLRRWRNGARLRGRHVGAQLVGGALLVASVGCGVFGGSASEEVENRVLPTEAIEKVTSLESGGERFGAWARKRMAERCGGGPSDYRFSVRRLGTDGEGWRKIGVFVRVSSGIDLGELGCEKGEYSQELAWVHEGSGEVHPLRDLEKIGMSEDENSADGSSSAGAEQGQDGTWLRQFLDEGREG